MTVASDTVFSYARWASRAPDLARQFRKAEPYPHLVLDDFLAEDVVERCLADFPSLGTDAWINYTHFNEKKFGKSDLASIPGANRTTIEGLNTPEFVAFLSALTGIESLLPDPALMGGGLHQTPRGGFLNVHADFSGHPHHPTWRRRVNLLLYLNRDWPDEYGGQLELWSRDMRRCVKTVAPRFNRAVIFETDLDTFHGHPEPLTCPEGATRKSIALYYFTDETEAFRVRSTEYRARPGDGLRSVPIFLDKMALRAYDKVKRVFGLNDDFASALLGKLRRRKRRDSGKDDPTS